jgi:hypothetical protein
MERRIIRALRFFPVRFWVLLHLYYSSLYGVGDMTSDTLLVVKKNVMIMTMLKQNPTAPLIGWQLLTR